MFSPQGWFSTGGGPGAAAVRPPESGRSRSPPVQYQSGTARLAATQAERERNHPITSVQVADKWLRDREVSEDVLNKFMLLPLQKRKNIVLKMMDKPPQNVDSWIVACCRNEQVNDLERRLTGSASLQNWSQPHGFVSGVPLLSMDTGSVHDQVSSCAASNPFAFRSSQDASPRGACHGAPSIDPSWTPSLLNLWSEKKTSQMMSEFLSLLDERSQMEVLTLPVHSMQALAFTLAVAGTSLTSPSSQVQQWLKRLQPPGEERSTPRSACAESTSASDGDAVHIQMVLAVPNVFVAATLVKAYLAALSQFSTKPAQFLPLIMIISSLEKPQINAEDVMSRLNLSVNCSIKTFDQLESFIRESPGHFLQYNIKTMMLTMLPSAPLDSRGQLLSTDTPIHALRGLHFFPMWAMSKCSNLLRSAAGDSSVAELTFAPAGLPGDCNEFFEKLVGTNCKMDKNGYNGVVQRPTVYACPHDVTILKCCQSHESGNRSLDEWQMDKDPHLPANMVCGMISHLIRLLEIAVFKERQLTPEENQFLTTVMMQHITTGERRYYSRDWWYRWWGMSKSPLKKHVDTTLAC